MADRRTTPAAARIVAGRLVVTDAAGGEFDFRGSNPDELTHTLYKIEAAAKCEARKAEYLRQAIALLKPRKR